MTTAECFERIAIIKEYADAGDDEQAHIAEKRLWHDVLRAIVDRKAEDGAALAAIAQGSQNITFHRRFA